MIQSIGNVHRVILIVYGRTISSPRLRLPQWLDDQYLPGVIPLSLAASFDWYQDAYPDDSGDPYQYLTWALALFRGGCRQEVLNKLYQTMLENLYLVTFLLGRNPQRLDIWHGSNLTWIEYAVEAPQELLNLWDDDAFYTPVFASWFARIVREFRQQWRTHKQ